MIVGIICLQRQALFRACTHSKSALSLTKSSLGFSVTVRTLPLSIMASGAGRLAPGASSQSHPGGAVRSQAPRCAENSCRDFADSILAS